MCIKRQASRPVRQRGLTLIELIVFIVIVSTALAGVLSVLNIAVMHSADPVVAKQMLAIAESLMEEVQAKDFNNTVASRGGQDCFSGLVTQENRASFDCVGNYNGFPGEAKGIYQSDGVTRAPGLADYTATVSVTNPNGAIGGVPSSAVWVITVTVSHGRDSLTLTGYRFNHG